MDDITEEMLEKAMIVGSTVPHVTYGNKKRKAMDEKSSLEEVDCFMFKGKLFKAMHLLKSDPTLMS